MGRGVVTAPAGEPEGPPAAPGPPGSEGTTGDESSVRPEDHAVGPGGATAATSRHAQGSLRREYLREAEGLIVEGDMVGGDKHVYHLLGGQKKARLRRLSARLVQPVRDGVFVPPADLDEFATDKKTRTAILRGPAGCGKQALGTWILVNSCRGPLFHLDSAIDLRRLAEWLESDVGRNGAIEPGAGFLLNQPLDFRNLHSSVLQGLDDALEQADARLVLTVGSEVAVPDRDLFDYIVELAYTSDYHEIFARHLGFRLGAERAERLMAQPGVRAAIDQQLATGASCKLAADLAEAVGAAVVDTSADDDPDLAFDIDIDKIGSWRSEQRAANFDVWFAELGDTRTRCFAIALAVLNGRPYDTVAAAARALYRKFSSPQRVILASAQEAEPEAMRPFRNPRAEWLQRLRALIVETETLGPYGRSPVEAIEFRDASYTERVLRRAWSDYEAQEVLVLWLAELASDASDQVRVFAGTALGRLASWSFDTFSKSVLSHWAVSDHPGRRDAAAYALRVVAAESRLRENVRSLVRAWYHSGDPLAQATAARAYGVALGPADPAAAFHALERLSAVDDIRVAVAVGDSVADLLAAETDEFAAWALPRLADLGRKPERSGALQLIFLILADGLVVSPDADHGTAAVSWPYLLHLAVRSDSARVPIVPQRDAVQRRDRNDHDSLGRRGRARPRGAGRLPAADAHDCLRRQPVADHPLPVRRLLAK
jgi:hypothetical protein